ncbi:MAG: GyrI-like domain-containing protein, partial [Thermovirgaceae bacterium]|nr:GyrI-like domain-containing protein [Thermovirgaceae bacterium]
MEKMDLRKELKHLYKASPKEVVEVDVPAMNFLMVDGEGDPNTSGVFSDAVEALFSVAYAVKFMIKKGPSGIDYGVMPLEGLWWTDDMSGFSVEDKSSWKWTIMIMQPDFVPEDIVGRAISNVKEKKNLAAVSR